MFARLGGEAFVAELLRLGVAHIAAEEVGGDGGEEAWHDEGVCTALNFDDVEGVVAATCGGVLRPLGEVQLDVSALRLDGFDHLGAGDGLKGELVFLHVVRLAQAHHNGDGA